jgi:ribonuclease HI
MNVSIFTDASVNPDLKKAGYAFYIGCKVGRLQKAGRLKVETSESNVAEIHCIANAIYTLLHSKFQPITKVFIYSDSVACLNAITGESRSFKSKEVRAVQEEIQFLMMEICLKHGKSIRSVKSFFQLTHVKAHTKKTDKLSQINAWCDENAKKYMRLPCKVKNK